jgi:hypothetical protein
MAAIGNRARRYAYSRTREMPDRVRAAAVPFPIGFGFAAMTPAKTLLLNFLGGGPLLLTGFIFRHRDGRFADASA